MDRETDKPRWDEKAIGILRAALAERELPEQTISKLRDECGFEPGKKALEVAFTRYCKDERKVIADEAQKTLDENRTRARSLIASGHTPAEAAEIMGVHFLRIYAWVPAASRSPNPVSAGALLELWLSKFEPTSVPDDEVISTGHLIENLGAEDCRWPIGKDADGKFRFCGCHFHRVSPATKRRPYCEAHARMDVRLPAEVQPAVTGKPNHKWWGRRQVDVIAPLNLIIHDDCLPLAA